MKFDEDFKRINETFDRLYNAFSMIDSYQYPTKPLFSVQRNKSTGELRYFLAVPGCGADDVELSTENGALYATFKVHKKTIRASCSLDENADPDTASASVDKGMLEVLFQPKQKKLSGATPIKVTSR